MFIKLFKSKKEIASPVTGKIIPLEDVKDEVFSKKVMGDGFAVEPENNEIVSPVTGVIESVFPTKHAITIKADSGSEILLHMGIDTVELKGKGFNILVNKDQRVKMGDKIAIIDRNIIKDASLLDTIIIISDSIEGNDLVSKYSDVKAGQILNF